MQSEPKQATEQGLLTPLGGCIPVAYWQHVSTGKGDFGHLCQSFLVIPSARIPAAAGSECFPSGTNRNERVPEPAVRVARGGGSQPATSFRTCCAAGWERPCAGHQPLLRRGGVDRAPGAAAPAGGDPGVRQVGGPGGMPKAGCTGRAPPFTALHPVCYTPRYSLSVFSSCRSSSGSPV